MSNTFAYTATLLNGDPLPFFIDFDEDYLIFKVLSIDINDAGTYEIIINATLDDGNEEYNDYYTFTIEVTNCVNAITSPI